MSVERTIAFVIYHLIGIPLFVLYIIELVLVRIRPEFSSPFYIIFFFGGIIDLLFYTLNVLVYQLAFQPWAGEFFYQLRARNYLSFRHYAWPLKLANILMFYLPAIGDSVNLLIAFNRTSAICFPLMYNRICNQRNTYLMIPLGLAYSIISVIPQIVQWITGSTAFFFNVASSANETSPVYQLMVVPQVTFIHWRLQSYLIVVMMTFTISEKSSSAEIRMFLLGFFILITTSPSIIFQIAYNTVDVESGNIYLFYQFLPWVILVKTLMPPLLLLATNQHMRREITMRVIPKLTMSAASTSSVVSVTKAVHVHVSPPRQSPRS